MLQKTKYKRRVSYTLSIDTCDKILCMSKEDLRSATNFIERLVEREYWERYEKAEKDSSKEKPGR